MITAMVCALAAIPFWRAQHSQDFPSA